VNVNGAFDTHANQLPSNALEFGRLGAALSAFARDLGPRLDDVTLFVTTEFGRTAYANGSAGTDHGAAHTMILLGAGVRGRRIHGPWPGLSPSQLHHDRELAVTTDYRDAFAELARATLGVDPASLFPGYTVAAGPGAVA
jgi:uncharacterized protein (DUF1501 family)